MKRSSRRGFTLPEVLVTMLFLAIVIPVAMRGVSTALAAAANARSTREATSLAQTKLQELTTLAAMSGGQAGDFGPEHPQYRWNAQTSRVGYGVDQIDLRVSWTDHSNQERGITMSTLHLPETITVTTPASSTGGTQ